MAMGLVGASIAVSMSTRSMALKSEFAATLNEEQLKIYESIINHRLNLYMQGFVLGILVGVLYLAAMSSVAGGAASKPTSMVVGTFTLIVLGVQYLFYIMMPKPQWMLDFVTTPEQTQKWLQIYRYMSMRWHAGLVMGILGAMAGCYGCLKK